MRRLSRMMKLVIHNKKHVDKTFFISTEDSLLNLAASDIVDSIFYSNILKFDNEDSSIYINRFFEYGAFTFYNQAHFISLIKEKMNVNVIPYEIYNEFGITKKKERDGLRCKGRRNGELSYSPSFPHKLCTAVVSVFTKKRFYKNDASWALCTYFQYKQTMQLSILKHLYLNISLSFKLFHRELLDWRWFPQ